MIQREFEVEKSTDNVFYFSKKKCLGWVEDSFHDVFESIIIWFRENSDDLFEDEPEHHFKINIKVELSDGI